MVLFSEIRQDLTLHMVHKVIILSIIIRQGEDVFFDDARLILCTLLSILQEICVAVENRNMNRNFVGIEIL